MNMLFCFVIIFIVVAIAKVPITIQAFLCLPFVMVVEFILALGVGMIASAITVYLRDFEHILGILAMAWMYMTPIIYPLSIVPEEFMFIFKINPMTPVTEAYRDILYLGKVPQISDLLHALIAGIVILAIGFVVFAKLKRHFAEEL